MIDLAKLHPRNWNLRLVWDLFMVWVALVNLGMILFDLSYLWLRPTCVRHLPLVPRVYDRVKGIEPHPLTEALAEQVNATRQLLTLDPRSAALAERVETLRGLTLRMLEEDPFERSRQMRSLEVIGVTVAQAIGGSTLELASRHTNAEAVARFWTTDPPILRRRLDLFDQRIRPLLDVNYFREYGARGNLVDHFWILDLPFLTLFIAEFAIRWSLAIRRRTHARWFFFPIFNWYDLLGLIPYTEFRLFRLFRIASIYMRLRRSELSRVGRDVLSRSVAYVSNIIAEEISDAVAIRILNEAQDEIRDGTHVRIFNRTIGARRDLIETTTVAQLRDLVASEATQERLRRLLRVNLERAAEEAETLRTMPLPGVVLRPLIRTVGEVVLDTTLATVTATLASPEGERATRELVATILDQLLAGPGRAEIEALGEEISLDVLEQIKRAVAVKKWALPNRGKRQTLPEAGEER